MLCWGWTLNKATICAQRRKQHVGVYAGDDESYIMFAPMFNRVIQLYHNVDLSANVAVEENYGKKTLPTLPVADAVVVTNKQLETQKKSACTPEK